MVTLQTLNSSILSLIILIIIYLNVYNRFEKTFMQHKLFITSVQLNMVLIIIDLLGWIVNGRPGMINLVLNNGFNLLFYLLEPLVPIIWVLYVNFQVFHEEKRVHKLIYPLSILFITNTLLAIISLYTRWFFYVTPTNIYHRGNYFWIHIVLCYVLLFYSFLFIIANRNKLEKSRYYALFLFPVPQVIGGAIQILYYGTSLTVCSMMISLLIVYLYIQNNSFNIDYLTGAYNRKQLDNYTQKKIRESTKTHPFAAILIDLNNFKQINDTFGHNVGDEALCNAVKVIQSCLRKEDFLARYGGDEFYIIMDCNDPKRLESIVLRINQAIKKFNLDNNRPYELSLSMGYDIYRNEDQLTVDAFFKRIDMLMYNNKEAFKKSCC